MMGFARMESRRRRKWVAMMGLGARCDHVLRSGTKVDSPLVSTPSTAEPGASRVHRRLPTFSSLHFGNPYDRPAVATWSAIDLRTELHCPHESEVELRGNQLHANTIGVRERRERAIGNMCRFPSPRGLPRPALMSDEARQNFSLRPEIVVPWRAAGQLSHPDFVHGGWADDLGSRWRQTGVGGGVRVQFSPRSGRAKKKA